MVPHYRILVASKTPELRDFTNCDPRACDYSSRRRKLGTRDSGALDVKSMSSSMGRYVAQCCKYLAVDVDASEKDILVQKLIVVMQQNWGVVHR